MPWREPSSYITATCDACGFEDELWMDPGEENAPSEFGWFQFDWKHWAEQLGEHSGEDLKAMKALNVQKTDKGVGMVLCPKCLKGLPKTAQDY